MVRMPWNMCQNLKWTMCAVNGLLPGQDKHKLHFATAPRDLVIDTWHHPDSWPCENGECPAGKFAVGDVFFAEVCILNRMCENGAGLFQLDVGQEISCDLSEDKFLQLAKSKYLKS